MVNRVLARSVLQCAGECVPALSLCQAEAGCPLRQHGRAAGPGHVGAATQGRARNTAPSASSHPGGQGPRHGPHLRWPLPPRGAAQDGAVPGPNPNPMVQPRMVLYPALTLSLWRGIRMVLYPGFLDQARCEHIIKMAKARLRPSSLALRKSDTADKIRRAPPARPLCGADRPCALCACRRSCSRPVSGSLSQSYVGASSAPRGRHAAAGAGARRQAAAALQARAGAAGRRPTPGRRAQGRAHEPGHVHLAVRRPGRRAGLGGGEGRAADQHARVARRGAHARLSCMMGTVLASKALCLQA